MDLKRLEKAFNDVYWELKDLEKQTTIEGVKLAIVEPIQDEFCNNCDTQIHTVDLGLWEFDFCNICGTFFNPVKRKKTMVKI